MNEKHIVKLQEDPETGDLILPFPEGMLAEMGWREGDTLDFESKDDGSFYITKKEPTEWVLVETISTFRERYMIEVPKGKELYALDTVTMNEAKEFSQQHLGQQIVSHRVVTKEEALTLCDIDNDYSRGWVEESKIKNFFTTWKEQKK
jgi:bifunctional DNA-binding transcriptional regulator/antitoxin component of YhaV-PrlF toxin-antitoxin module